MIRVLVGASSPVVRAGLDALLRAAAPESVAVVGTAPGDAAAVADEVARLRPDVVLIEVERQAGDGAAAPPAALLAALWPGEGARSSPAAVLLADDADAGWVAEALRAGVRGVLPRGAGAAEILAAVEGAAAGLVVVHPDLAEALLAAPNGGGILGALPNAAGRDGRDGGAPGDGGGSGGGAAPQPLTPRESEVLAMLAEGLGNKQIAPRLGITEHTVKYHIASIFAKLGASSRTEAVAIGARRGLVML